MKPLDDFFPVIKLTTHLARAESHDIVRAGQE